MIPKAFVRSVVDLLKISLLICFSLCSQSVYSDVVNKKEAAGRKNFEGKWVVREVLDLAPILPIDETVVNSLPGKVLTISNKFVSFVEFKCPSPRLNFTSIQTARFFGEYKMEIPKNLPNFVNVFTVVCDGRDSYELSPLIIRSRSLLLIWRGALVELVRQ